MERSKKQRLQLSPRTTLGRKNIEALSGVLLLLFCFEHLIGNSLLLLPDVEWYTWYTEWMGRLAIVRLAEILLFLVLGVHIAIGIRMRMVYLKFRANNPNAPAPRSASSRFVGSTGVMILVFLVVHLERFFLPNRVFTDSSFHLVSEVHTAFTSTWYTMFYVASMFFLGFHLQHGIASAVVSLPFLSPRAIGSARKAARLTAVIVSAGLAYIAIHLWIQNN